MAEARWAWILLAAVGFLGGCTSTAPLVSTAPLPTLPAATGTTSVGLTSTSVPSDSPTPATTASGVASLPVPSTPASTPIPATTTTAATESPVAPTGRPKPPRSTKPGDTPGPTPLNISLFLTGRIEVLNAGDIPVEVGVTLVDPDSGTKTEVEKLTLQQLDGDAEPVPPGIYIISFTWASGSTKPAACTVTIVDNDSFEFVTIDEGAIVVKNGKAGAKAADMAISTSPLCKASVSK